MSPSSDRTTGNEGAGDIPAGMIKVIGIGQSMRGDDAAGLAAVSLWQESYAQKVARSNVNVELAELPGIGLLNLLEGVSLAILVDAVHSGATPGKVHRLTEDQLGSFTRGTGSAHGWGAAESLAIGRQLMTASLPDEIILIGIEAGDLSLGASLSLDVQRALPEVVHLIEQQLVYAHESTH